MVLALVDSLGIYGYGGDTLNTLRGDWYWGFVIWLVCIETG